MPNIGMGAGLNAIPIIPQSTPNSLAPPPVPIPAASAPINSSSRLSAEMEGSSDERGSNPEEGNNEIWSSSKANRRTKERKISFVIEKVSMWRKLYNGIQDNQGKIVRYR